MRQRKKAQRVARNAEQSRKDLEQRIEKAHAAVSGLMTQYRSDPILFIHANKLPDLITAVIDVDTAILEVDFGREFLRTLRKIAKKDQEPTPSTEIPSRTESADRPQVDQWAYMDAGGVIRHECRRLVGLQVPSDPIHASQGYEEMPELEGSEVAHAYSDMLNYRRSKYREALKVIHGMKTKGLPGRPSRAEWLAKAMLCVQEHPEWSDSRIAGEVGIHKTRLSRSPEYRVAAQLARRQGGRIPRGFRAAAGDPDTAGLEAIEDPIDSQEDSAP